MNRVIPRLATSTKVSFSCPYHGPNVYNAPEALSYWEADRELKSTPSSAAGTVPPAAPALPPWTCRCIRVCRVGELKSGHLIVGMYKWLSGIPSHMPTHIGMLHAPLAPPHAQRRTAAAAAPSGTGVCMMDGMAPSRARSTKYTGIVCLTYHMLHWWCSSNRIRTYGVPIC